jgi:CRISPR/Cas system type I-B associated protein Csh2 (Cas7 group RAMP superfamily)
MENEFSLLELRLIQSLIKKSTDEEIADIVGRPVDEIRAYTSVFSQTKNIVTKQNLIDRKNSLSSRS